MSGRSSERRGFKQWLVKRGLAGDSVSTRLWMVRRIETVLPQLGIAERRALAGSDLAIHAQGGGLYCLRDVESEAQRFMTRPDILIKHGTAVVTIIDTKWKRLSAYLDDPKQGVNQADVYQMMAYGQLYRCRRLMLLYPHHAFMSKQAGIVARHRVTGTDDQLIVASIDVSTKNGILGRPRELVVGFERGAAA